MCRGPMASIAVYFSLFAELSEQFDEMLKKNKGALKKAIKNLNAQTSRAQTSPA